MRYDFTQDELKAVLDYDPETGIFRWKINGTGAAKIGSLASSTNIHGYKQISINGHRYMAHRLAWFYFYGAWPLISLVVDHINCVRDDNRISNLRIVDFCQNASNQSFDKPRKNGNGYPGACWHKRQKKWNAHLQIKKKIFHLGCFDSAEEASLIYLQARKKASELIISENPDRESIVRYLIGYLQT